MRSISALASLECGCSLPSCMIPICSLTLLVLYCPLCTSKREFCSRCNVVTFSCRILRDSLGYQGRSPWLSQIRHWIEATKGGGFSELCQDRANECNSYQRP
jgi:hypothetical protein